MNPNSYYCPMHNQEALLICTENHNCENRRLCILCYKKTHQNIAKEKTPLFADFNQTILKKLNSFQEQNYKHTSESLDLFDQTIQKVKSNLKNQISAFIESIQMFDSDILQLKNKLEEKRSIGEFSNADLNFMIQIANGNFVEERQKLTNKYGYEVLQRLGKAIQQQIEFFQNFLEILQSTCKIRLSNEITLEGPTIFRMKCGEFQYVHKDGSKKIVAGTYALNHKQGKWKDVEGSLTYSGQYQAGERVGEWIIAENNSDIGGGYYNNGIKERIWKEPQVSEHGVNTKIVYSGEYRSGKRVGTWTVTLGAFGEKTIQCKYDDEGRKQEKWIEPCEQYGERHHVTFQGKYLNGKKIGEWQFIDQKGKRIGGGKYNEYGFQQGQWVELDKQYDLQQQAKFSGQYQDGKRINEWKITENGDILGGGTYDNNGMKQGAWIELHEKEVQLKCVGHYKNDLRIGTWMIKKGEEKIGEEMYNELGQREGEWIKENSNKNYYNTQSLPGQDLVPMDETQKQSLQVNRVKHFNK